MWPFDRPSRQTTSLFRLNRLLEEIIAENNRTLRALNDIKQTLGLKPDPVPRPASQSLPPKLAESSIHVVTRQDVIRQERENAVQDARRAAGIVPSPEPSPESPSQPTEDDPLTLSHLEFLNGRIDLKGGWADTPDQASKTPTSPSSDS